MKVDALKRTGGGESVTEVDMSEYFRNPDDDEEEDFDEVRTAGSRRIPIQTKKLVRL